MEALQKYINLQHIRACLDSVNYIRYVNKRLDKVPVLYDPPVLPDALHTQNAEKKALYDIIMSDFPGVNDSIARENLRSLTIRKLSFSFIEKFFLVYKTNGFYSEAKNRIYLDNLEDISTLYHELAHAFSSVKYNGIEYCGFAQFDPAAQEDNFWGICEQYASLIQYRRKSHSICKTELDSVSNALLTEAIVGPFNMSQLFFTANTKELVLKMESFLPRDEYLRYLRLLDFVYRLEESSIFNRKKSEAMIKEFEEKIREYEKLMIEAYEDKTHSKLVLKI